MGLPTVARYLWRGSYERSHWQDLGAVLGLFKDLIHQTATGPLGALLRVRLREGHARVLCDDMSKVVFCLSQSRREWRKCGGRWAEAAIPTTLAAEESATCMMAQCTCTSWRIMVFATAICDIMHSVICC